MYIIIIVEIIAKSFKVKHIFPSTKDFDVGSLLIIEVIDRTNFWERDSSQKEHNNDILNVRF
jgi:hypothetical protein